MGGRGDELKSKMSVCLFPNVFLPITMADDQLTGVKGFMKGLGFGLAGVVALPVAGVVTGVGGILGRSTILYRSE